MRSDERIKPEQKVLTFMLYFLGLILLFEWINPLNSIVGLAYYYVFLGYAIFCFIMTYIKMPTWISFMLKLIGLLGIIQYIFLPNSIFSELWKTVVRHEWIQNYQAFLTRDWYMFTDLFQMLLFLIIIALVSYLLYFWLITMNRVLVFITLTIVLVTVMDTFTEFEADGAIIRLVVVSLLMLTINYYLKQVKQRNLSVSLSKWFRRIIVPLTLIILVSSVISYRAPKNDPIWPDPVPYLTNLSDYLSFGSGSGMRRIGYGEDDSVLGGSFQMDDTTVFHAQTSHDHYWRIESKDYYSGHGWYRNHGIYFDEFGENRLILMHPDQGEPLSEAVVEYSDQLYFNKLVYPYGLSDIYQENIDSFVVDLESGQIEPNFSVGISLDEQIMKLQSEPIQMTYQNPNISIAQLREGDGPIPHSVAEVYLQLPDALPTRVVELAESIVADQPTRYDQVAALESYFLEDDFIYQTSNIPIPGEGQDFVDQFLFDTQAGYCDHFSTAMVVMLRSVGIPARWAKGFTSGEQIDDLSTADNDLYHFEITNNNAHSWVEVYFPNIGWVPFEPTIGFSGNDVIYDEQASLTEDPNENDMEFEHDQPTPNYPEEPTMPEVDDVSGGVGGTDSRFDNIYIKLLPLAVLIILMIVILIKWKSILVKLLQWRWSRFKNEADFHKAYQMLLRLLKNRKFNRSKSQTLHEFAKEVDDYFASEWMTEITDEYAKLIYQPSYRLEDIEGLNNQYHKLVRRILA